jgi:glycosyltransferase involved in cell wall biosynthesis
VPVDVHRFVPLEAPARARVRRDLLRELGIGGDAAVVLFAGRLEHVKRPLVLPALAAALRDRTPPVHVLVAGTGSLATRLRQSAERNAPGRVHLLGTVPHPRLAELMAAADALILPSGFEALPNVVLESLACGTPVVACRTGGLRRLVLDGRTGLLAGQDPRDLAAALGSVLDLGNELRPSCRLAAMPFAPAGANAELFEDLLILATEPRYRRPERTDPLSRAPEPAVRRP